jgi:hypothetical protein
MEKFQNLVNKQISQFVWLHFGLNYKVQKIKIQNIKNNNVDLTF